MSGKAHVSAVVDVHPSAPDTGHLSGTFSGLGADQGVALGLVADGEHHEIQQVRISFPLTERGLHIDFTVGKKTTPHVAFCGQPQPVAVCTKVIAHGPDKADFPLSPFQQESLGRGNT